MAIDEHDQRNESSGGRRSWRASRRRNRALGLDRFGRPLPRAAGTNPRSLGTNPRARRGDDQEDAAA